MKYNKQQTQNKHAGIRTRYCRNGKLRTETYRRDAGTVNAAVTTDERNNKTSMFIDLPSGEALCLSGHEAQMLYRLLEQHYDKKNWAW